MFSWLFSTAEMSYIFEFPKIGREFFLVVMLDDDDRGILLGERIMLPSAENCLSVGISKPFSFRFDLDRVRHDKLIMNPLMMRSVTVLVERIKLVCILCRIQERLEIDICA